MPDLNKISFNSQEAQLKRAIIGQTEISVATGSDSVTISHNLGYPPFLIANYRFSDGEEWIPIGSEAVIDPFEIKDDYWNDVYVQSSVTAEDITFTLDGDSNMTIGDVVIVLYQVFAENMGEQNG